MKNNFLKNGKSVLSLVVAFAVIAVSLFAAVPGINLGANAATVTDTWDGTTVQPTETDTDGNIIIKTAEELAWVALVGGDKTKDQNYKVVAGSVFNMNGMAGITADSIVSEVIDADRNADYLWLNDSARFQGNFDGNGLVVYNINSDGVDANGATYAYGALFPAARPENTAQAITIKNVTVAASYFEGYHAAAGIVADVSNQSSNKGCINVENCLVKNCYLSDRQCKIGETCQHNSTSGLMVGTIAHNSSNITNCIAINNVEATRKVKGGFVGKSSDFIGTQKVVNSIAIGSVPYSSVVEGSTGTVGATVAATSFTNVYTTESIDKSGITVLTSAQMQGAVAKTNMSNLDWSVFIAFDGEYPDLRSNHELTTVPNGDSGHVTSCSECGKSLTETHNMVEDMDAFVNKCACGYTTPITEINDTWDGTKKEPTDTDDDGNIIIKSAEELAWVALMATSEQTVGKNYKVADNCVFNMDGMTGITLDSTASQVNAAAKNSSKVWTAAGAFSGNFDGNGAIVYNINSSGSAYAGLFPNTSYTNVSPSELSFRGITVKASYFSAYNGIAGIVGNASGAGTSSKMYFDECAVINCYMTATGRNNDATKRTVGTIVGDMGHAGAVFDNCLVVNNTLDTDRVKGGFVGNQSYYGPAAEIKNSVSIGTLPYSTQLDDKKTDHGGGNMKPLLSPKVSTDAKFTNVYTDQEIDATYSQITTLTVAEMSGTAGLENVALDFGNVWFANEGTPELKLFHTLTGAADTTDAYAGHTANCEDCGLKGVGLSDHVYDDAYSCTVCGFDCDHKNADYITTGAENSGDCVTAPYIEKTCDCGYSWKEPTGTPSGHKLTKTDAKAATCAVDGNKEYWTCSECGLIFLEDNDMAAFDTAVAAEDVVLSATGAHAEAYKDGSGELLYGMDETKHWTICKECEAPITENTHTADWVQHGAEGHTGACSVCLYETADGIVPHNFGDDSVCDQCGWTCESHVAANGEVKAEGDCVTDRVTAQYCNICKIDLDDKVETAKGHALVKTDANDADCTKDGNIDYWTCSTCENVFLSDDTMAAMDTAVELSEVVVEKLAHKYTNVNDNGKPVYEYDGVGHWYDCEVCGKAEYAEHTLETDNDCEGVYQWCEDADGNSCGYETFDYTYSSDDGSATVVADTNAFTKDVVTDLIQITTETSDYAELEEIFKAAGHTKFAAYEFSPSEEMAEGGKATITIAVPDVYGNNAAIYYVDTESGKLEKLETKLEEVEGEDEEKVMMASAVITKTGVFAVAADEVVADENDSDNNANNNANNGNSNQTNNGSANNNGDTSNTSPATSSETVAAVAAVAALSAAAIVFARKFKKA